MTKLIALYRTPDQPDAFDKAYFETHLPLLKRVPGLLETKVTRITRTLMGDGFYLMAEMSFEDEGSLKAAMRSPEMDAAGTNLDSFASGLVTLMFGIET